MFSNITSGTGWRDCFRAISPQWFWVNVQGYSYCTCEGDVVMMKSLMKDPFERDYGHLLPVVRGQLIP